MIKRFMVCAALAAPFLFGADIVKNGVANASVIVGENPTTSVQFAALELVSHIEKISGATLRTIAKDDGATPVRIWLGPSEKMDCKGFKDQEYALKVDGNDICLAGKDYESDEKVDYSSQGTFPDFWKSKGTCYAVYDFLERLGVRWYMPSELATCFTPSKDISVADFSRRHVPTIKYRDIYFGRYPENLCGDTVKTSGNVLDVRDTVLWRHRMRHGGFRIHINHSLYRWYDRFLKTHPEYFAVGYDDAQPPQLCYSNPEVLKQVVQDARDFFDGKKDIAFLSGGVGADYRGDVFPVFPMDNSSWCKCPECQKQILPEAVCGKGKFSNDKASNYIFGFVNKVAREVAKTHPGKYIGAGTYADFCYPPADVKLEPNVMIIMCFHTRNVFSPAIQENDDAILNEWCKRFPDTWKNVWMYFCFPSLRAKQQQTRLFPGFFAHSVGKYMEKYRKANVQGMFWEPSYVCDDMHSAMFDQVEGYVNWTLAFDGSKNADALIDEMFAKYYGPAEKPMKAYYELTESRFVNPANYKDGSDVNLKNSWEHLGTDDVMAQLEEYVKQARELATESPFKERVAAFDNGVWTYMRKGKENYKLLTEKMNPSMQQSVLERLPAAKGDCAKIDWSKANELRLYGNLMAENLVEKIRVFVAQDGEYLYVKLSHSGIDADKLQTANLVWLNDEWELFFGNKRAFPMNHVAVDAKGNIATVLHDNGYKTLDFKGSIKTNVANGVWDTFVAVPLSEAAPVAIAPGQMLYFNFIRSSECKPLACWIPTFEGFIAPGRLGELYIK
ncbi:MAG: DUF4838 domain-containing protein [Victivallales bacterium]|nr:DUF4838 domain-containing protein [Victivallales bacterium]